MKTIYDGNCMEKSHLSRLSAKRKKQKYVFLHIGGKETYFKGAVFMEVKKENSRVKDPADKAVLKKPENFAGIFNLALTGGKVNLVKAEELVELDPNKVVFFDAQGNIPTGEKRMDVEKEWIFKSHSNGQVVYAMRLHLEVQSTVDFFMPVRALIYSAAEYDEQMRRIKRRRKCEKFIPVLPLIANLSLTPWSGYRSFQECLEIPCLLKPYVSDYIPDFKLLIVEPQVVLEYSILPSEVGIPFRVFAAVNDLNKILVMVNEEKILNGISDDAYNMIRSRIDLDFMRRKNETMKKIDVFKETEKRLKKESAKIEAEKNKVIAEKNKITAEKNKLDIQRSELDAKRSELDVQKSELDDKRDSMEENLSRKAVNMLKIGYNND